MKCFMEWIKKLLIDTEKCILCQKESIGKYGLCDICRMQMQFVDGKKQVEETEIYFPLLYTGVTKNLLEQYKFSDRSFLATVCAEILADFMKEKKLQGELVIVPSTPRKIRHRGFDHMDLIAKKLEGISGRHYLKGAVEKIRDTKNQHDLPLSERVHNLDHVFSVTKNLKGKKILILDDIVTSKQTLAEMIREIKKAQASAVTCVTICSVSLKDM